MLATMKKMYRFVFAVAAAATALVGCVREPEMLPAAEEHPIQFIAESIETRTAFGDPTGNTYPTLWTANDTKVKVSLNMVEKQTKDAAVTPSSDFKTATFSASFADTTAWNFFALSPASAYLNVVETVGGVKRNRLGVTVPTSQTPTASSVDEAAQILVAQSSATGSTAPESVSFDFHHWTSYGKLSLSNLTLADGAAIEAVDLTAEVDWAGRWYYFFSNDSTAVNGTSGAKTITVNTTSASDIWFACAPVDMSGKKLTVVVRTNKGTLTKEFTMPANRKFVSGQIARFTVNMSGAVSHDPVIFERVTSSADLVANSKIIIAAAADEYNYAISTSQTKNNRSAAEVDKADNKITDPSSSVDIFTLEAGIVSGTYSFKGLDGNYIYAPGTGNHLRSKAAKDSSASWTVTFHENYVVVESITKKEQRFLRFNPNTQYNSPLFSCYKVDGSVCDSVALYKLVSGGEEPPVEKQDPNMRITTLNLTLAVGETGDASVESIASDYDGDISYSSSNTAVATVDEDGIVTAVSAGTCTVTVTASETEHYLSATKTCNVTVTSGTKTIAELLALKPATAGQTTTESYEMNEATVMAVSGSNVIVKDATGVMLLFKGNTGFEVGDRVTATGKVQNYYGLCEFAATATAKVSSGATVDHGTPVAMDAAAITTFASAPFVQYAKLTGTLPADGTSSSYMKVGTKNVALYVKTMYADSYGMQADVYGYTLGMGGAGQLNFINTSIDVNANVPFLNVDATSHIWEANETSAFTVNVSVETGGNWTFTADGMSWATVTKSGNSLVVTPSSVNTSSTPREGTVVLKNSADQTKTKTVEFKQLGTGPNYEDTHTSNVTLSTTGGTNASAVKVVISETQYDALKAGKSSDAGAVKITVPAGTTKLHFHAFGWNGKSVSISVSGGGASPASFNLTSNSGIANNSPFTVTTTSGSYHVVTLSGVTAPTTLTFTATEGYRFVIWGVNAE